MANSGRGSVYSTGLLWDSELKDTLIELQIGLKNATEDWLEGLYIVGSISLDFHPKSSDIDLIGIIDCPVEPWMNKRIKSLLSVWVNNYKGIELCLVKPGEIREPKRIPIYEFGISIGGSWRTDENGPGEDSELLIHFEIARRYGIDLFNSFRPVPEGVFTPIPKEWILEELRKGISWHLTKLGDPYHDPFGRNSTLNACRALRFKQTSDLVSKSQGGEWYLQEFPENDLVKIALDNRQHGGTHSPDLEELRDFLKKIISQLN